MTEEETKNLFVTIRLLEQRIEELEKGSMNYYRVVSDFAIGIRRIGMDLLDDIDND